MCISSIHTGCIRVFPCGIQNNSPHFWAVPPNLLINNLQGYLTDSFLVKNSWKVCTETCRKNWESRKNSFKKCSKIKMTFFVSDFPETVYAPTWGGWPHCLILGIVKKTRFRRSQTNPGFFINFQSEMLEIIFAVQWRTPNALKTP